MSEERLQEIKDSIEFQAIYIKEHNFETALLEEEADLYNEVITLKEENERLNNIINEIEKWCDENYHEDAQYGYDLIDYSDLKDKIEELKGVELTENDKKQVKWLKEEFKVGVDKE